MIPRRALRDAYGHTLVALGKEDSRVVALDADLAGSTRSGWFAKAYPDRFFQMGVAEADMMGTASGLALAGLIPFASTFAAFGTGRCYDQIRQSICLSNANVKVVVTHGGLTVGEDGASHQMLEDLSLMLGLPGMRVLSPCDYAQTVKAVRMAHAHEGPVFLRLTRWKFPDVYAENDDQCLAWGKANLLREGKDLVFCAVGLMVSNCLEAAAALEKRGLSCGVLDCASLKPLDKEAVMEAAVSTGCLVSVEEHSTHGGLGEAVSQAVCASVATRHLRLGVVDQFGTSGRPGELIERFHLDSQGIVDQVMTWLRA